MGFVAGNYDVIVVGAGHAGCEAGLAAARLGKRVLMLTSSLESVALMPCNPSIGGPAKGHLVREIDALGGEMGRAVDACCVQLRMLNTSKGPAVRSMRAQIDKNLYQRRMRQVLAGQRGLWLKQAMVESILHEDGRVRGVRTQTGTLFLAPTVILTTGTYLRGRIIVGDVSYDGGPNGLQPAMRLSESLRELGVRLGRFKTGSPPRISSDSIDTGQMTEQPGDDLPRGFADGPYYAKGRQMSCWLTYTNAETHRIFRENLYRAPLYSGDITSSGPRFCPSLEDKVVRFADKERHQVFVEPEGYETDELYVQGFSTSMPEEVQYGALRTIEGLKEAEILRPGYAIEYDYIDPTQLNLSLEFREVPGLFAAGQINGSSGYEEAAAQGLLAGINAARLLDGTPPLVIRRSEAYLGVLIDDLVTKGVSEPYRLLTSLAEYRLLLRHDNADLRLKEIGWQAGLISDGEIAEHRCLVAAMEELISRLEKATVPATDALNSYLVSIDSAPITQAASAAQLLRRPEVGLVELLPYLPPEILDPEWPEAVIAKVETEVKYAGYIKKQQESVERFLRLEEKALSPDFPYGELSGLSLLAREKLTALRPASVGQAGRITGVSPADISVLLVALAARGRQKESDNAH